MRKLAWVTLYSSMTRLGGRKMLKKTKQDVSPQVRSSHNVTHPRTTRQGMVKYSVPRFPQKNVSYD